MSINYINNQTVMSFISHASVLLNYNDEIIITDPWYISSAFNTWWSCPPPLYNIDMILGIIKSGKAKIVISHAHPDHIDRNFIKLLPSSVEIYIPKYKDSHFIDILKSLGIKNIIEIENKELKVGKFILNSYAHYDSDYDAAVSIESPDAFIFHGNDSWRIKEEAKNKLKLKLKNLKKASLLMGQGGSASGYPLTYYNLSKTKSDSLLIEKNNKMIISLAATAKECRFDNILAYACFSIVKVQGKNYSNRAPIPTAQYCNKIASSDKFLDLSPGDIYLPKKGKGAVIPLIKSLHINQNNFIKENNIYNWPTFNNNKIKTLQNKTNLFCKNFDIYLKKKHDEYTLDLDEIGIEFMFEVLDENENIIAKVKHLYFNNIAERTKVCRVRASVLNQVLNGKIPFEDLSIGYLAEWDRIPVNKYNKEFMSHLKTFWNIYVCK